MKLLYKPFALLAGIVSGLLAKRLFSLIWGLFDGSEPPKATTAKAPWSKVLGAAALQAVTFKLVRTTVDRAGAKGFERLTGIWPGEPEPEPVDRPPESQH